MTKEIWAAVIIAIAQIIISIVIAWKQIEVAKVLANPDLKQVKNRNSQFEKLSKYLRTSNLSISIPFTLNVALITFITYKYGYNLFVSLYATWILVSLLFQSVLLLMISVLQHIMRRLLCHESILFQLTDKPCNDDGVCKFKE